MVRYSLGFFFVYSWIYSIYYWMSTLDVNICWVYFNLQMKYRHNKTARKYKQVQKHFIYQFRISFKQINTNYPKKKIVTQFYRYIEYFISCNMLTCLFHINGFAWWFKKCCLSSQKALHFNISNCIVYWSTAAQLIYIHN